MPAADSESLLHLDRVLSRYRGALANLGFDPDVAVHDEHFVHACEILDAWRQNSPRMGGEDAEFRGLRQKDDVRRLRAALRIDRPRGVLFGAREARPVFLSSLVSDLLALKVEQLRRELPPQHQEAEIAQHLGLLLPGESFAMAVERLGR